MKCLFHFVEQQLYCVKRSSCNSGTCYYFCIDLVLCNATTRFVLDAIPHVTVLLGRSLLLLRPSMPTMVTSQQKIPSISFKNLTSPLGSIQETSRERPRRVQGVSRKRVRNNGSAHGTLFRCVVVPNFQEVHKLRSECGSVFWEYILRGTSIALPLRVGFWGPR